MIDDLLCSFDDMLKTDFVIRNPLISCGISEARSKLLEDCFAASAMSAPAEALFSRMGDIISKKRNKLSPTTIRMLAILKSRGIIREEEIPQDNADTEDDVDQPIELTDEQEDAGVEELLVVDDAEDDEVIVGTSTATQVFET
ncbi:hypothetical protein OXX69_004125 [Metschnikowia pulcherrima]